MATARVRQAEGDAPAALALLDEAERVYNSDFSPPVRPVPAVKARTLLAKGDVAAARRWASGRRPGPDDELSYMHEYKHVTLARVLLAEGRVADATRLLQRLLAAAEHGRRAGTAVEILVALSLAQEAGGDHTAAAATLEEALVRAQPEGRLRVFVDELASLAPLLRTVSRKEAASDVARQVLATGPAAVGTAPPAGRSPQGLVDELSSRELDVLRLLKTDLSGPEIASELVVSLNTMRTHTKNIGGFNWSSQHRSQRGCDERKAPPAGNSRVAGVHVVAGSAVDSAA